jgi:hypothetical protein
VNACIELASVTTGLCGLTTRTARVAVVFVTVSVVEPFTLPSAASIVLEPVPTAVARPFKPAALLIVATLVLPELHVTVVVIFFVLLSL